MERAKKDLLLQRISNHLILNGDLLDNLGLFHGKIGIVIFLYHYSRFIKNSLFN